MPSLEFAITPAADPSPSNGTDGAWSPPASNPPGSEQFDAIMGRTIAHSRRDSSDNPGSSGGSPTKKEKSRPNPSADSANSAAPITPPGAEAAGAVPPAAAPANPSQTGSAPDSATTGVTASGPNTGASAGKPGDSDAAPGAGAKPAGSPSGELGALLRTGTQLQQAAKTSECGTQDLQTADASIPAAPGKTGAAGQATPPLAATAPASEKQDFTAADSPGGAGASANVLPPGADLTGSLGSDGISGAQQSLVMQKSEKTTEVATAAQQNLPAVPVVAGEDLPVRPARPVISSARQEDSGPDASGNVHASSAFQSSETISTPALPALAVANAPLASLDRTHELMSLHAVRLRDSGADSLQVMIKPGNGLQLSLNLQMRNGTVEVQATLHHGDLDFMNRHWNELQQQLESRGVRLGQLASGEQFSNASGQSSDQSSRQQPQDDAAPSGAGFGLPLGDVLKAAIAKKVSTNSRAWETWA